MVRKWKWYPLTLDPQKVPVILTPTLSWERGSVMSACAPGGNWQATGQGLVKGCLKVSKRKPLMVP